MFNQPCKDRNAFQRIVQRTCYPKEQYIAKYSKEEKKEFMDFLEISAATTEAQSSPTYVTPSYTSRLLFKLESKRKAGINIQNNSSYTSQKLEHGTLDKIDSLFLSELDSYNELASGSVASLA